MKTIDTIIADLVDQGLTRDGIIIHLVSDGNRTLNFATNAYAAYARENGLTKTIISHKSEALEYLADMYPLDKWTPDAVLDAIAYLADEYGVALSTARDYCKAYSDTLGIPLPNTDPRAAMFTYITENINHKSRDELRAGFLDYAVNTLGRSKSNANEYAKGLDLHFHIIDNA
jgi:hypothetical protein